MVYGSLNIECNLSESQSLWSEYTMQSIIPEAIHIFLGRFSVSKLKNEIQFLYFVLEVLKNLWYHYCGNCVITDRAWHDQAELGRDDDAVDRLIVTGQDGTRGRKLSLADDALKSETNSSKHLSLLVLNSEIIAQAS